MTTSPTFGLMASWRSDSLDRTFAHLVGPQPDPVYDTQPPYLALYVGGHGGVRISIPTPEAAEHLAQLLTEAAAQYRATAAGPNADDPAAWDDADITIPHPQTTDPATDNDPAGPIPVAC